MAQLWPNKSGLTTILNKYARFFNSKTNTSDFRSILYIHHNSYSQCSIHNVKNLRVHKKVKSPRKMGLSL